jgi:hypothetical protein
MYAKACPFVSFTMKHTRLSSISQGGGKLREGIDRTTQVTLERTKDRPHNELSIWNSHQAVSAATRCVDPASDRNQAPSPLTEAPEIKVGPTGVVLIDFDVKFVAVRPEQFTDAAKRLLISRERFESFVAAPIRSTISP